MTKDVPLLSIVTISFNQVNFLRESIESVLAQKDDEVEYVVVDPGSVDGSRDLLETYRGKIDRLILEPDNGPADGLNKGFARSSGKVGYFLNSDDFLLPGAVAKIKNIWSQFNKVDVILAAGWMVDENSRPIRQLWPTRASIDLLRNRQVVCVQQGMSFRLDHFRSIGGFNPKNRTCWDFELLVDFALAGARIETSNERIGAFRIHDSSLSGGGHGDAHEVRYQNDSKRIDERLVGVGFDSNLGLGSNSKRIGKYLANPRLLVNQIIDTAMPSIMRRRWEKDFKRLPSL